MKLKQRILVIVSALSLLLFTLIVQISSNLTPFFSHYPFLFTIMASLGIYITLLSTLFATIMYFQSRKAIYSLIGVIFMMELIYISFTLLGEAFQLGIAGLTLALSLLLLGIQPRLFIYKNQS